MPGPPQPDTEAADQHGLRNTQSAQLAKALHMSPKTANFTPPDRLIDSTRYSSIQPVIRGLHQTRPASGKTRESGPVRLGISANVLQVILKSFGESLITEVV